MQLFKKEEKKGDLSFYNVSYFVDMCYNSNLIICPCLRSTSLRTQ